MPDLFYSVDARATEEEKRTIAETGVVPSHLKSNEDKLYIVIFRNYMLNLFSCVSEDVAIDGEAIICKGRKAIFDRVKEYLANDGEQSTDLRKSIVMVEGVDMNKGVSLYRFLKLCNNAYPEDTIDEVYLEEMVSGFTDGINPDGEPESYNIIKAVEKSKKPTTGFGNSGTLLNR